MLAAWVIFPALLLAVCLGIGLLVEELSGRRLPGTLLAALGMAAVSVVGLATTAFPATASWTAPTAVVLAVAGFVAALLRRRGLRPDPWALLVALAVFGVSAAPVVLSGDTGFAGYIKLDDTATWFAITDRLLDHGRSLSDLPPSSYEATLDFNLAGWYPVGAFIPFGVGAKLSGQELAWVFQPYLALLASFVALALWQLAARIRVAGPAVRAAAVFLAAQAATLFAYAMWGGVKELATAALLGLTAALVAAAIEDRLPTVRSLLPPAICTAALVGVLSFGAGPWLFGLLGTAAVILASRRGLGAPFATGWRFAVWLVPLIAIGLIGHPLFPESTKFLLSASTDLGNLAGPVSPAHLLGIWPAHDFREPLVSPFLGALISLVGLAALGGAWGALRDRDPGLLVALGGAAIGCALIALFGSAWVAAKSYAIVSPFVLLFAFAGLGTLARLGSRSVAISIAALLGAGIVWSNALGYGGVSLAPRAQLGELQKIGERFAGVEPALMTEYQPYGVRHFLRAMAPEGASELRRREVGLRDGSPLEKGETADIDRFSLAAVLPYRALVLRRSPSASRPPGPYRLAWHGRYYDVWVRRANAALPLDHLPLGTEVDPAGVPACPAVMSLAKEAGAGGSLVAARPSRPLVLALGEAARVGDVAPTAAGATYLEPEGAGEFAVETFIPSSGLHEVWLGGSIRPSATLLVDEGKAGEVRQQLNTRGNYIGFGPVSLRRGRHTFAVQLGGADLYPGSAGSAGPLGPLAISSPGEGHGLLTVPAARARSLCGRRWDWVEAYSTR